MLSRVADSIYWMSRYIERAENVARFIDVNLNLSLDMPASAVQQWEPLVRSRRATTSAFDDRYGDADAGERDPVPDLRSPRTPIRSSPACAPRARTPAPCARSSRPRCGSRSTSST